MNLERLKEAENNKEKVFLRMSETADRPLIIMDVSIKKIFTEKPKNPNISRDVIATRVRLQSSRCLIVYNSQLFSDRESAELGYEKNGQENQSK